MVARHSCLAILPIALEATNRMKARWEENRNEQLMDWRGGGSKRKGQRQKGLGVAQRLLRELPPFLLRCFHGWAARGSQLSQHVQGTSTKGE